MLALSIRQPWARYIIEFGKDVENRSWYTDFRGRIYVHASKAWDMSPCNGIVYAPFIDGVIVPDLPESEFPLGAITGSVEIVDCVSGYPSPWAVKNQYQLVLKNPVKFNSPIPMRGSLRLFDVTDKDLFIGRSFPEKQKLHMSAQMELEV